MKKPIFCALLALAYSSTNNSNINGAIRLGRGRRNTRQNTVTSVHHNNPVNDQGISVSNPTIPVAPNHNEPVPIYSKVDPNNPNDHPPTYDASQATHGAGSSSHPHP